MVDFEFVVSSHSSYITAFTFGLKPLGKSLNSIIYTLQAIY